MFETGMVNEPSVFEPLKFDCILKLCTYVARMLKMCMLLLAEEKIIFDKVTAFSI